MPKIKAHFQQITFVNKKDVHIIFRKMEFCCWRMSWLGTQLAIWQFFANIYIFSQWQ
jgi:hypothetical protein